MRLLSLEVENYRNIASASLTPGRELTVICGNNGQGKTNLLEAIWLLTGGKSFRGGKDAELVRRGEPFALLKASTLRAQQEEQETEEPNRVRLTVGAPDSPRPGRTVSVNGGAVKRAASLAGSFPAVVFDPGHLSLVKGAPEGRRKFLDAALCQLYPGYLTLYRRYVRALQQKNALLRRSSNGIERPYAEKRALLEVLNVELAQQGDQSRHGFDFGCVDFAVDGLLLVAKRRQSFLADHLFGHDEPHDVVVAHAESLSEFLLPAAHAVAVTEDFERPDVDRRVGHERTVHVEYGAFYHMIPYFKPQR